MSSLCAIYGNEFPVCRAKVGAVGAKDLLELTPCDLFPYIRGRTLWLVGDSMMQVGPLQRGFPFLFRLQRILIGIFMTSRGQIQRWLTGHLGVGFNIGAVFLCAGVHAGLAVLRV